MIRRRDFIAGVSAVAWPALPRAQTVERVRRVGFLVPPPLRLARGSLLSCSGSANSVGSKVATFRSMFDGRKDAMTVQQKSQPNSQAPM